MTDRPNKFRQLLQLTIAAEVIFWAITGILYVVAKPSALEFLHPGMWWLFALIPAIFVVFYLRWQWRSNLYDAYHGMGKTRMIRVTFQPSRYFLQYFFLRSIVFF